MPARPSRASASWMLIVGVAIGALLAPVGAVAAGQLVEISSTSGRKADVTRSSQLQVAEAAAHQFVSDVAFTSGSCASILTAPTSKAVVVKTAWVDFSDLNGTIDFADLSIGQNGCGDELVSIDTVEKGGHSVDFGPGLVIPAGYSLWVQPSSNTTVRATAFGYKIPPEAAPATAASGNDAGAPSR